MMHRKIDDRQIAQIWVERIVWNLVAVAVLAGMIGVLLWSLQWLDRFEPESPSSDATIQEPRGIEIDRGRGRRATQVARVSGPGSGSMPYRKTGQTRGP